MNKLQDFLITQIEIDLSSITHLREAWSEPRTEHQNYILAILKGKCYGYLNALKESIK